MPDPTPDVLTPFFDWADRHPDRRLFCFLDEQGQEVEQHTYGQFVARTGAVAAFLQQALPKLRPGDRVLLAYPPGLDMITAFFACVRLGWIPVPVYPPTSHGYDGALAKMNFIAQDCAASAVLTTRAFYWSMRVNRVRHRIRTWSLRRDTVSALPWVRTTDAPRAQEPEFRPGHSETLFLQYTSGSTRNPRGVMVSHANLLANGDAVVDHLPVGVSWLPQYHDMGLIGYYLFFAMKGGTTYGFSPVDFIQRPLLWLETITRYRGTATSAPDFAFAYCLREDKVPTAALERLDLSSLRFLMNAAEPVRAPNYRAFLQRFRPAGLRPEVFFSAFGLAEYTLAATNYGRRILSVDKADLAGGTVTPSAAPSPAGKELVSCGAPLPGVEIRIVDPESGVPQPADQVGEVWLAGPSRCAGYWNHPRTSREVFEARVEGDPDTPWLRTGDLGFLHEGELFHCGRLKDLVILRGQNYYPQDVEAIVQQDPRVRAGCSAAFSVVADDAAEEALVVVAELRDPAQVPDGAALSRQVQAALGIVVDTLVWIPARTIAKTSSGKVSRHRVKQAHLAGELRVIAEVHPGLGHAGEPAAPAADPVHEVLARYGLLGTEAWTLAESGLDSLRLVELAQDLKDVLAQAGLSDLSEAVTVQSLQQLAVSELGALLTQVAESPGVAKARFRRVLTRIAEEHRAFEQELMQRDTRLNFDPASLPGSEGPAGSSVLLTGGTGFFGPFLLLELLRQIPERPIVVLVRAATPEAARARLLEGLAEVRPLAEIPPAWLARIQPVCGDLARANLGLTTAAWEGLAGQVGTIYHNGAQVNYLYDYATLRPTNVAGTNEVLRLAMSHRPKQFNHVSTTFVFGWSTKEVLWESDPNEDRELLDFGYSQSKWVAEQVVRDAMQRGLQARIFRPALITPSVAGGGGSFDIAVRLLAFMVKHQLNTTAQNQVSFCPADLVARNVVAIGEQPESVGRTFHVTRDEYATMSDVTAILADLGGLRFSDYELDRFVTEVTERCVPGDILFPLLDFFLRSMDKIAAMEFKRYDNASYREFRARSPEGLADPPLRDVVSGLWRFMKRKHLIDSPAGVVS